MLDPVRDRCCTMPLLTLRHPELPEQAHDRPGMRPTTAMAGPAAKALRLARSARRAGWLALLLAAPGIALGQRLVSVVRQDQQLVPLAAYAPGTERCHGVAVLSPGAGGSEQGQAALAEAMAAMGYHAVVVGHAGSGREALRHHVQRQGLRDGLATLTTSPEAYRGRLMDIDAARRWARDQCPTGNALLVGHSMGAATVMIVAGARNRVGVQGTQSFDAYIALSPQGPGAIFPDDAWAGIRQPVLMLTGTRDDELGGAPWEHRTLPFHRMPPGCKWLGVVDGATHMQLGGNGRSQQVDQLTAQMVAGFVQAVQRGDCQPGATPAGIQILAK